MSDDNSRKEGTEQNVVLLFSYTACTGAKRLNGIVAAICDMLVEVAEVGDHVCLHRLYSYGLWKLWNSCG